MYPIHIHTNLAFFLFSLDFFYLDITGHLGITEGSVGFGHFGRWRVQRYDVVVRAGGGGVSHHGEFNFEVRPVQPWWRDWLVGGKSVPGGGGGDGPRLGHGFPLGLDDRSLVVGELLLLFLFCLSSLESV